MNQNPDPRPSPDPRVRRALARLALEAARLGAGQLIAWALRQAAG